jgi:hypothetical protein
MIKLTTAAALLVLGGLATPSDSFLRNLQEGKRDGKPPKFYGDDVKIEFKEKLGCGACIRGGYIFCIPFAEGSDPSTWGGLSPVCCKNTASCPQLTNGKYFCSNSYSDTTLAKAICPFRRESCGNSTGFNFDSVG